MLDTTTTHDLPETLERAAAGDAAAWSELVRTFAPRVCAVILAKCGDRELAEEITQSTFCAVVARLDRYAELGRFQAWLYRIAVNRLRDELRRRRRRRLGDERLRRLLPPPPAGEPRADHRIGGEVIGRALRRLSEVEQEVVHLRYFGGLSFEQIAGAAGRPLGTVLARHHRALQKLRDVLRWDGAGSPTLVHAIAPTGCLSGAA